ncbi:MAG TPA: sugar-transfer associated ATP-grasp domain-containing protein [Thermoanaerobaculia bacterium]
MMQPLFSLARAAINRVSDFRYHRAFRDEAMTILRSIESVHGRTNPEHIKASDQYAADVLGWGGYAPWLYVYSAVQGRFREGWIPDNYYGKVVIPVIQADYRVLSSMKSLSRRLLGSDLFPDLASHVNGLFLSPDHEVIQPSAVPGLLFSDSDTVVFKRDRSGRGSNVVFLHKSSFDVSLVRRLGSGVFQQPIVQHPIFARLMPSSAATLRFTTVVEDDGTVSLRDAYLRLGRSGETHVKSDSQVKVCIDLESGRLDPSGYLANWLTVDRHPDTGVEFAGTTIPEFSACVSAAKQLHSACPAVRCVGWDMIVDEHSRVRVMEWNSSHNGIKFSEATKGPCFADLGWEKLWRRRAAG